MNNDHYLQQRQQIEEFFTSGKKHVLVHGAADTFRANQFCKLLWPGFWAEVRLSYNLFLMILAYLIPFTQLKVLFYRIAGVHIGRRVYIGLWVWLDPSFPELISIGDDCLLGMGTKIGVHIMTHKQLHLGRVKIGNKAVCGGYCLIRPGVDIGDGAIVGLGAVVYRDVPPGATVIGNPARVVKNDS